jgi:hypothetical protein
MQGQMQDENIKITINKYVWFLDKIATWTVTLVSAVSSRDSSDEKH